MRIGEALRTPLLALALVLGAVSCAGSASADDSCKWAQDGECDEPGIGTGACAANTDTTDCSAATTCQWANDRECDEPGIGTGACAAGTDPADCAGIGKNNCQWANDGECDEPGIGTGACALGTDTADCRPRVAAAPQPSGDDSCRWARDGECDEPVIGGGACPAGTDRTDCANVAPPVVQPGQRVGEGEGQTCAQLYASCSLGCGIWMDPLMGMSCRASCTGCFNDCQAGRVTSCD